MLVLTGDSQLIVLQVSAYHAPYGRTQGKKSPRAVQETLSAFGGKEAPSQDVYKQAYDKTLELICSQGSEGKELALETLSWLVFASTSLTSAQLLHALATQPNALHFDDGSISDIEDVVASCCGLIAVEDTTTIVHLAHHIAYTFLKGSGSSWLVDFHSRLSNVCVSYLSLRNFDSGMCYYWEEYRQ